MTPAKRSWVVVPMTVTVAMQTSATSASTKLYSTRTAPDWSFSALRAMGLARTGSSLSDGRTDALLNTDAEPWPG